MVVAAIAQARTPGTPLGASPALLSLDLGSGPYPAAGYVGVDVTLDGVSIDSAPEGLVLCDLLSGTPWPFEDGSAERLRASHFIEHIPHERVVIGQVAVHRTIRSPGKKERRERARIPRKQDAFFWFFDECHRIAAPGCRFELAWPHPDSDGFDQDPTHCRRVLPVTLQYLSRELRARMGVQHYEAHSNWSLLSAEEIAPAEALEPFRRADGSIDVAAARRARNVFTECRAVLVKE